MVLKVSPKNARALSVRVLDEDGKPVAAAAVAARHRAGGLAPLGQGPPRPVDRPGKQAWVCDREGRETPL